MGRRAKPSKWLKNADSNGSVTTTARRALDWRKDEVWRYLALAVKGPDEDTENVHKLRVATRRAAAALRLFRDLVPVDGRRELKRMLGRVRRAASDARDLDVLIERLTQDGQLSSVGPLISYITKLRKAAQQPLRKVHRVARKKSWKRQARRILKDLRWSGDQAEPPFGAVARTSLQRAIDDFFTAAYADLSDIEAIHQMRIEGKRLRYTMELVAGVFNDSLRKDLYPVLADVQESLGTINDHASAKVFFESWMKKCLDSDMRDVLLQLVSEECHCVESAANKLRQWWSDERAADLRSRFDQFGPFTTGPDLGRIP